jgi:hypothetical protein
MEYGIKYRAVPDRMIPLGDPTLENVHNIVQLLRPKSRILDFFNLHFKYSISQNGNLRFRIEFVIRE